MDPAEMEGVATEGLMLAPAGTAGTAAKES